MKHRSYNVDGYAIDVYDDLFTLAERTQFYNYISNSSFKFGWEDTSEIEYGNYRYFYSSYNNKDRENLGIFDSLSRYDDLNYTLHQYNITKSIVNLSIPVNTYFNHSHVEDKVLLYYANLRWKEEWGGETLFYDDSLNDILFASPFTPGRVILFDGQIPHTLRPQAGSAPHFRFTFTTFLTKHYD
jgi:hypothetical protein